MTMWWGWRRLPPLPPSSSAAMSVLLMFASSASRLEPYRAARQRNHIRVEAARYTDGSRTYKRMLRPSV